MRPRPAVCAGSCLWAGYQSTYSDSLTGRYDSSKWTQTGSLSAGSNGVTGDGSLISTVAVATGSDYDVRMTIHTANQGLCTGSYTLYARSTSDNSTAYVLTIGSGTLSLFKEVAKSWTLLSAIPSYCADGTVMRLVVRGGNITTWSGPIRRLTRMPARSLAGSRGWGSCPLQAIPLPTSGSGLSTTLRRPPSTRRKWRPAPLPIAWIFAGRPAPPIPIAPACRATSSIAMASTSAVR